MAVNVLMEKKQISGSNPWSWWWWSCTVVFVAVSGASDKRCEAAGNQLLDSDFWWQTYIPLSRIGSLF